MRGLRRQPDRLVRHQARELVTEIEPKPGVEFDFNITRGDMMAVRFSLINEQVQRDRNYHMGMSPIDELSKLTIAFSRIKLFAGPEVMPDGNLPDKPGDLVTEVEDFAELKRALPELVTKPKLISSAKKAARELPALLVKSPIAAAGLAINLATITGEQLPISRNEYTSLLQKYTELCSEFNESHSHETAASIIKFAALLRVLGRTLNLNLPDLPAGLVETIEQKRRTILEQPTRLPNDSLAFAQKARMYSIKNLYFAWLINNPISLKGGLFVTDKSEQSHPLPPRTVF
ncbi:MAG: hypothetical protein CO132_03595 [Candidatus Kerfeldbacteria bacterium CG_4_9_14_3_um_filter_45_8]|nr:MAG: hypothetical protein CO132_03595 [Candidatus Kerfeldbacteria bacterium CG_4_9_14_3_um_filter_45_8]